VEYIKSEYYLNVSQGNTKISCHSLTFGDVWHFVGWLKNVSRSIILNKFRGSSCPYMSHVGHSSKVPIRIHERNLQIIFKFAQCGPPFEGRGLSNYGLWRNIRTDPYLFICTVHPSSCCCYNICQSSKQSSNKARRSLFTKICRKRSTSFGFELCFELSLNVEKALLHPSLVLKDVRGIPAFLREYQWYFL